MDPAHRFEGLQPFAALPNHYDDNKKLGAGLLPATFVRTGTLHPAWLIGKGVPAHRVGDPKIVLFFKHPHDGLQPVGFARRLVPSDATDAREAHGYA